jgi:hypothetical protein
MSYDVKIFNLCDHYTGGKQYMPEKCPKCLGKGYYYDIAFDKAGQAVLATGSIKLQQEMLKIINDVKGDNPFFERWGSELHDLIGQKSTKLTSPKLQLMIRTSLEYLRFLQCEESDTYNNMTMDEILLGVESIKVDNYYVGYDVSVVIKNTSNEILEQTILL